MNIEEFFGETGPLANKFEGYIPRPQQIELASAIENSFRTGEALIGEAPTGVGKSLAALVPAFRLIKREDAPVVVVTSSILLQEQYFYKDIPLLEEMMGMNVNAVLMKGKSNYLCLNKMVNQVGRASNTQQVQEMSEVMKWADKTKTGDVSELDIVPSRPVWSEFAVVDEFECAGKDCGMFAMCHYYNNRRRMKSAKLIVCNYHYFFTAIKTEGMLPMDVRAVIFDEGHEISSIARDMEEKEHGFFAFKRLNQMLAAAQKKIATSVGDVGIADQIELLPLLDEHQKFFENLTKYYIENKPANKDKWVIEEVKRPVMHELGKPYLEAMGRSLTAMESYLDKFGADFGDSDWVHDFADDEVDWIFALMRFMGGLEEKKNLVERFIGPEKPILPYEVLNWIEDGMSNFVTLRSKPFNAAPITGPIFNGVGNASMEGIIPVVLSATLSVNQTFSHLIKDLGIEIPITELAVGSPFNLTENLLWYLPKDIPAGNDPQHLPAALNEMEKIIRVLNGKTLCLFTSNKAMQAAINHFERILPSSIKVIAQGAMSKKKIIEEMKLNNNVVIIATKSFFTGVDIQGQNLSAVLIDKIPFPMAGDPINDFLMNSERGFWRHTLPETVITMKQGFGRLNRTVDDKGVVAVLDGRLSTQGYKTRIFNSFDFKVTATRDFEQVKTYLEGIIHANK